MHITDKETNTRFLVDCGAAVSLMPATAADKASRGPTPQLTAANGSPVQTFNRKSVKITLHGRQFTADVVTADIPLALLGVDFLRRHKLLVDSTNWCLIDTTDGSILPCSRTTQQYRRVSAVDKPCHFKQLLLERPALTTPNFNTGTPAHGVQMHILTTGPPVYAKARRLAPEKLEAAKKEFALMEQMGIIRRSKSA